MAGRGRGRGRAPPTGGRLFLMRSADECGFDSRNLRSLQDVTRPELFPDILLHSSGDNKMLRLMEEKEAQEQSILAAAAAPNNVKIEAGGTATSASGGGDLSINNVSSAPPPPKKLAGTKLSSQALFLITKGREIHHRIQNSAYHVKATKDVPDIIRYSDSTKPPTVLDASTVLSHCLRGRKRTAMGCFVPEELVSGQKLGVSNAMSSGIEASIAAGKAVSLSEIEARDLRLSMAGDNPDNADSGAEEDFVDEGSEEDGEDYCANYYESEGDESAGGGNEATFE